MKRKTILQIISYIALVFTIAAPIAFLAGSIDLDRTKTIMLIATLIWFVLAPFWMERKHQEAS